MILKTKIDNTYGIKDITRHSYFLYTTLSK